MEFNLLNMGKKWEDWWVDLFVVKWDKWEPGIFRIHCSNGKWEWDLLGIGEVWEWWKMKK